MIDQLSKDNTHRPHDIDTARRPGEDDARVRPLPIGHRLGELQLDAVLGVGGFGIVYRAFDRALQRVVAIKEYMPSMLATRGGDHTVTLRSERFVQAFDAGRAAFVNEARLLAQFDHPGLVKVLHFWEAHGTAYMAMPFYEGQTLKQSVDGGVRFGEARLHEILDGVLGALDTLHRAQCFHRDISLDNVLIRTDGKPVLLDFGAARRSIGDLVDDRAVMLKPGYAPIEQYTDDPAFTQGPWTDIYGLGALVHAVITGELPSPAVVRSIEDKYQPLATRALPDRERYSQRFLGAIDHALQVRISDRPESIAAFANELGIAGFERTSRDGAPCEQDRNSTDASLEVRPQQPPEAKPSVSDPMTGESATSPHGQESTDADADAASSDANRPVQTDVAHAASDAMAAGGPTNDERGPTGGRRLRGKRPLLYGAGALVILLAAAIAMSSIGQHEKSVQPVVAPTVAHEAVKPSPVTPPHAGPQLGVAAMTPPASGAAPSSAMASPPAMAVVVPPAQRSAVGGVVAGSSVGVPTASLAPSESVVSIAPTSAVMATPPVAAAARAVSSVAVAEAPPTPPTPLASPKSMDTVRVHISVKPWGEVYIDGVRRGISPPLRTLRLAPGAHEIQIRNGNLPPLQRVVTIDADGKPVNLDYTFE